MDYDPRTGPVEEGASSQALAASATPQSITPTATSSSAQPTSATNKIKVKIVHKDDIFAIKVPANSTLDQLRDKVHDRLGFDVILRYKDEATGDSLPLVTEMDMEEAFASAVKLGKLTVYAERI